MKEEVNLLNDGTVPDSRERDPAHVVAAQQSPKTFSIGGRVGFASVVMAVLILGLGGWAATAKLNGAVMAPGSVVVDKNVKKVQHSDGGIVARINVKNGDVVKAGQVLIELDSTQIRAELTVVRGQLTELTARRARLNAQSIDQVTITFPQGFEAAGGLALSAAQAERRLFNSTRDNVSSRLEQLELQISQLDDEIRGIIAQNSAKEAQLALIRKELAKVEELYERKLTTVARLYSLQREESKLSGEVGGLLSQIARSKGKISEIRVEMLNLSQNSKLEAQREMRTTEAKINELREREIAAADRMKRTTLFAPRSGVVHELAAHTLGGVVTAAESVMLIVPGDAKRTVEARFSPVDIDQIVIGRQVRLRFSAFNHRTTPEVGGNVTGISADISTDEKSGQQYYLGQIALSDDAKQKLQGLELLPGMPVEVFVSTGARTAFSYMSKPITDQFNRAFREE